MSKTGGHKASSRAGIESRSIDYVPLKERHGKAWDLGPLWFMSNAQVATLAVGLISITTGGNLVWSLIAIIAGVLLGTLFMAAHSAQGPQLGLPQMIQSRPQFGYIGALLVWLFAYVQYAGFNVFNTVLGGQAAAAGVHHGSSKLWFWVITAIAVVVAVIGYDLIHAFERYLTIFTVAALALLSIAALSELNVGPGEWNLGHFHIVLFLGQLGVAAGYQISWAIYVSDYSRYLPPDVTVKRTFQWTFWGSAVGGIWMMILGAYIGAAYGEKFDTIGSLKETADKLIPGLGSVLMIIFTVGLASIIALNMYGGSLTLISSLDSIVKVRPSVTMRVATVAITAALSLFGAFAASTHFLANFNNFLLLVLYFFIPWTAVNLTDYFIVRRGHYAIAEIFKPDGIYRRWGWPGIVAYLVSFAAMIPFFSGGTLFTGFIAKDMSGADISMFVGLPIAAGLYWVRTRNIDVESEIQLAEQQQSDLETRGAG